jgi:NAD(P)H-dependent flavin oxidoreductase YrpB (nitropropane dioxygenase family)
MQAASDIFLGWTTYNGRDYYGRQLRDMKLSAEVEAMVPVGFTAYVGLCAATLARAHARTSDPAQISGYLGTNDSFDQAIASFAQAYADQAERDHAALLAAIKEGRMQAQTGV